jgi:hypothetical protein
MNLSQIIRITTLNTVITKFRLNPILKHVNPRQVPQVWWIFVTTETRSYCREDMATALQFSSRSVLCDYTPEGEEGGLTLNQLGYSMILTDTTPAIEHNPESDEFSPPPHPLQSQTFSLPYSFYVSGPMTSAINKAGTLLGQLHVILFLHISIPAPETIPHTAPCDCRAPVAILNNPVRRTGTPEAPRCSVIRSTWKGKQCSRGAI